MKWQKWTLASGLLWAMSVPMAIAENAALLKCSQVADSVARLACFDRLAAISQAQDSNVAVAIGAASKPAVDLDKTLQNLFDKDEGKEIVFTEAAVVTPDTSLEAEHLDIRHAYTPLSLAFDLDGNDIDGTFTVRPYKRMYLAPAWYNQKINYRPQTPTQTATEQYSDRNKHLEAKMQISFKTKIAEDLFKTRADLWFGYTQVSHWQVYNNQMSAPFRNTDYEPEVFITQPVKADLPFGGQLRMLGIGLNHQSNGQSDPWSRSWNRLIAQAGMEWGNLTVMPRVWYRFSEKRDDDDNPDITDYMGHGEIVFDYRLKNNHSIGATTRFNPKSGKGGLQLEYAFPINKRLRGFVQMYNGYGMNLLDYNHRHRSIGVGVMLNDWNGL